MGLRLKSTQSFGHKIATLMAVFALVFQPVSGFVAGQLASAVSEADIYVNAATAGTEANTYATITDAIDAASNNHVISVAAGVYNEKVSITKNLTLRGEAGAIVNGPANSQAIEVRAQDNVLTNVTISNLIVNAGTNSLNVINVSNGSNFFRGNLLLENLTINGNNAPAGIGLMQTDGVTIDNATISNAKVGVEVVGAQNLKIQNSRIENATTGIHVWNTTGYGPRNNTLNLTGNTLTNNATGIKIDNARNVTISGGAITGGHSAVSAKDSQTLKINGVTMSGQSSLSNLAVVGLIGAVEYAEITGNTIKDAESTEATAQAILLGDTGTSGNLRYVTIDGNTLQNVSGARGAFGLMVNRQMSMETGAQLKFTNNIVDTINGTRWMAGVGLDRNTPNAEVTGNTFRSLITAEGTPVAINVNHREGNTSDATKMTIKQNNFNTPGQLGVNYDWADGTSPAASKYLDASENYWGDLPGPAKGVSATAGQYVKYSNWLCAPAPSNTLSTGDSKGCVQPVVTSVEPGKGGFISGTQRVYINVSNPEVMKGGFLQLNKATPAPGVHPNDGRTNYPIKQDNEGRWYAEVDTTNIVALNDSGHQGDGNYLFRVEAHHEYGHSAQHPWGNYGNNPGWTSPSYHFVVDNTAPEIGAELNGETIVGGVNYNPTSITVQASDALSGLAGMSYTVHDASDNKQVDSRSTKQSDVMEYMMTQKVGNDRIPLDDGDYYIQYHATDKAENRQYGERHYFTIDNTRPTVNITDNSNSTIGDHKSWKDARNVAGTIEEANLGTTKLFRANDDTEFLNRLDVEGNTFKVNNGLPEGTYYIVHTDKVGNESKRAYFVISNKKPLVSNVENTGEIARNSEVVVSPSSATVNFTAGNGDNSNAEVNQVTVRGWIYDPTKPNNRGGAAFTNENVATVAGDYDINLQTLLGSNWVHGGKYIIMIEAVNQADVRDQYFFTVELDLVAPAIAITGVEKNANNTYTISGTTDDNDALVRVFLAGIQLNGNVSPANGRWSLTVTGNLPTPGTYNFTATSQDAAGNESEDNYSYEVSVVSSNDGRHLSDGGRLADDDDVVEPIALGLSTPGSISLLANTGTPLLALASPLGNSADEEDEEEEVAVLGDEDRIAQVSGESTTTGNTDDADKDGCWSLLGLCWYWWVLIVAAVITMAVLVRRAAATNEAEAPGRRL